MMEEALPPAIIWAIAIGSFVFGLVIGLLIGVGLVWDQRFNAGRRYGYSQGREYGHSGHIDEDAARYWRDRGAF